VLHAGNTIVAKIAFTPDGKQLVSVAMDHTVRLWDLASGQEVGQFVGHTDYVTSVAISPDGKWLATGADDNTVRIWDLKSRMEMHRFKNEKFQHPAESFSPDSSHLAVSEFPGVHIWDVSTFKQLQSFSDPHSYVTGVGFSADGKMLATTLDSGGMGWNGAAVWDASSGQMLARFAATTTMMPDGSGPQQLTTDCADFSPDGKFLVTAGLDVVRVWEIASQKLVKEISSTPKFPNVWDFGLGFFAARFSHNGRYMLTAGGNNTLYIWEVGSWRVLRMFHGHFDRNPFEDHDYTDAEFSKDDSKVAASSSDGSIWVWQLSQENGMK